MKKYFPVIVLVIIALLVITLIAFSTVETFEGDGICVETQDARCITLKAAA